MRAYLLIIFSVTITLSGGCATIVAGSSQTVTFDSSPQGANVLIDGQTFGATPTSISLKKGDHETISFQLQDYRTVSMDLGTRVEPWFFGNFILGGLFGTTTDMSSGAIYKYSPDRYFVTLTPKENPPELLNHTQQVERFIVVNFRELQSASATQNPTDNEYFKSLVVMIGATTNDEVNRNLTEILLQNSSPVDAAKKISQKYLHVSPNFESGLRNGKSTE